MTNHLPENIRSLRKERALTQEQLAEAMGVSVGAVSKWELSQSTPEITMLMELADFFGVSVDALLGYEMRSHDKEHTVERLSDFLKSKDFANGRIEAEKALKRFPNSFEVVYKCAQLYHLGIDAVKDSKSQHRALELLEHACCLIDQNTDETISELSLRITIADVYLLLNDGERALEELKRNNPCGLNDARIGYALAAACGKPDEALPWLSTALMRHVSLLFRIVDGYLNAFHQKGEHQAALDLLTWALTVFSGLKYPEQTNFLEKAEALLQAARALTYLLLKSPQEAKAELIRARETALRFDAAPNYQASHVRFYHGPDTATAYDDIGVTAIDGICRFVKENSDVPGFAALWGEVLSAN